MNQRQGKIALVTGAAGGFGKGHRATVRCAGARVTIVDLDAVKVDQVAAEPGRI